MNSTAKRRGVVTWAIIGGTSARRRNPRAAASGHGVSAGRHGSGGVGAVSTATRLYRPATGRRRHLVLPGQRARAADAEAHPDRAAAVSAARQDRVVPGRFPALSGTVAPGLAA